MVPEECSIIGLIAFLSVGKYVVAEQDIDPVQLTSDQTERILRIRRRTIEVLGARARQWLTQPNRALNNEVPLELALTKEGIEVVEGILGRIEQGIYS
jgi:putative toxin-antitoxin system antitoxin component (TIGR02293 family)